MKWSIELNTIEMSSDSSLYQAITNFTYEMLWDYHYEMYVKLSQVEIWNKFLDCSVWNMVGVEKLSIEAFPESDISNLLSSIIDICQVSTVRSRITPPRLFFIKKISDPVPSSPALIKISWFLPLDTHT